MEYKSRIKDYKSQENLKDGNLEIVSLKSKS